MTYINYSLNSFTCTISYLQGRQPMSRSIKALVINHTVSCPLSWHHIIYRQVLASIIHLRTSHLTFHIIHGSFSYYKHVYPCWEHYHLSGPCILLLQPYSSIWTFWPDCLLQKNTHTAWVCPLMTMTMVSYWRYPLPSLSMGLRRHFKTTSIWN